MAGSASGWKHMDVPLVITALSKVEPEWRDNQGQGCQLLDAERKHNLKIDISLL